MLEVDVLHTRSVLPVKQNRSISISMNWGPVLLSIHPIELTFLLLLNTYLDLCIFVCIIIFIFIDHIPSLLFFSPNLFMHRIHSKPEIITDLSLFFLQLLTHMTLITFCIISIRMYWRIGLQRWHNYIYIYIYICFDVFPRRVWVFWI